MHTVNVLKLRTLKNNYFLPLFIILEITFFFIKKPVFEILECGLYQE